MKNTQYFNRFPIWVAGFIVLILLSGAMYIGGRMIKERQEINSNQDEIEFIIPDVVPETEPELKGIVLRISNENLVVQEFQISSGLGLGQDTIEVEVNTSSSGAGENHASQDNPAGESNEPDGIITEVVITRDTKIYKNVTKPVEIKSGEQVSIEMDIKPGTLAEIKEHFFLTVWGERRGNRVIADFILYRLIAFSVE